MKLLIITHLVPYPLSEGGKVSQYALIDYLRYKCSITLVVFTYTDTDVASVEVLKKTWPNVSFEVISMRAPNPIKKRRSVKSIMQSAFRAGLHKVNVWADKVVPSPQVLKNPEDIPNVGVIDLVDFIKPRLKKNIDKVSALIQRVKPDIVQLEFVYLLDLSLIIPAEIKKVFVHHELRFMRVQTEMAAGSNKVDAYANYLKGLCEITEIGLLNNFDAIVTMSEDDKDLLQHKLPDKYICSSPFPILDKEISPVDPDNLIVKKLVFVGGEFHSPNKDAVEWYINSMAAMVHEKFSFVLHVIGNWSEATIKKYSDNSAVCFTGYVEDLNEYCKNSIMLVPLRIGSGIRQKILYAVAAGVPVISTTIGSEGIIDYEKICLTANTPQEFVNVIGQINNNADFSKKRVFEAQYILKKHYSQEVAGLKRLEVYHSVLSMSEASVTV